MKLTATEIHSRRWDNRERRKWTSLREGKSTRKNNWEKRTYWCSREWEGKTWGRCVTHNPDNKELAHPHSRWTLKCWKLSETRPDQWPASVHLQALQGHRDISRWQKNRVSPLLSPRALSMWMNFSRRPISPWSPQQVFLKLGFAASFLAFLRLFTNLTSTLFFW